MQILIVVSSWKLNSSIQWKKMNFFRLSWQKNFSLLVSNRILVWDCWFYRAAALIARSRVVKNATPPHQIRIYFSAWDLIAYLTYFGFCVLGAFPAKQLFNSRLLTHLVGHLPFHIRCALVEYYKLLSTHSIWPSERLKIKGVRQVKPYCHFLIFL